MPKPGASLRAGTVGALLVAAATATGGEARAQSRLDLPAADLAISLNALSRAAGVEILADPAVLRGRTAPAVSTAATPEAALRQILQGTGLVFRRRGRTFLIVRAPRPQPRPPSPARARTAPSPHLPVAPAFAPDPQPEIVVTGTHIARPELESAMPVALVRMDDARAFGRGGAYDALVAHPAIGPGVGLPNTQGEPWDAGAAFISLRNMGTNRSLTLIDGRRRVSGAARSSAVDINMIPPAMIDRIEVATGGAAAIYGADAVTGAVNVIMEDRFEGLTLAATNGLSGRGDAGERALSLTTGHAFADGRGSLVVGGTYARTSPLPYAARHANRAAYVANPASSGPQDGIADTVIDRNYRILYRSRYPVYYHDGRFHILKDGVLSAADYERTHTSGEFGAGSGSDGATGFENHLLRAGLRSAALVSRFRYALTPAITVRAHLDYGQTRSASATVFPEIRTDSRPHWFGGAGGEVATLDNPFLPASLRAFMVANGLSALRQDRSWFNFPQPLEIHKRDSLTAGVGLGGALGRGVEWQVFFQHGRSVDKVRTINIARRNEWIAARDVIADPETERPVCRDPSARAAGCVPLDIFSTAPASAALIGYVLGTRREWRRNTQHLFSGEIGGKILRLPHGDLSVALGVEWRRDALSTRDDPDAANLANLVYLGVDYILHPALDASRKTSELYGEAVAPILADLPMARQLKLEAAYRYSRYSGGGRDTHTWKLGAIWEPVVGVILRGVRSHSVRVPNFGELHAPEIRLQLGIVADPCNALNINQGARRAGNCAALGIATPLSPNYTDGPLVITGGNPDLSPETSDSYTAGLTIQPGFLPGAVLTADYWNIAIGNVITLFPYTTIMNLCVDSAHDNIFCHLQTRDPATGHLRTINSFNVNVARMRARGIDVALNYRRLVGRGDLELALSGTYLMEQTTVTAPGIAGGRIAYAGQYDHPRFKGTMTARYRLGRIALGANARLTSRSAFSVTDPSPETRDPRHVPAAIHADVMLEYAPTDKFSLAFGIRNVGNTSIFGPLRGLSPGPNVSGNNTGAAHYDAIGRYFFTKIEIKI